MELFTLKKNYQLQWDDIPFIENPAFGREHALDAIRYGDKIWKRVTNIKEFVAEEIGHFNPCGNNCQTELKVYDLFHQGTYFSVAHHKPFAPAFTWKPDAQHPNKGEWVMQNPWVYPKFVKEQIDRITTRHKKVLAGEPELAAEAVNLPAIKRQAEKTLPTADKPPLKPYVGDTLHKRTHSDGHAKDPYTLMANGAPLGAKEGVMPIATKGLEKFPKEYSELINAGYPDVISRKDFKNFSTIHPKTLAPDTKIYRIVDEGSSEAAGQSGCYWAYSKPANKAEWRSNYAVKDSWNDNGYYVEHTVGTDGLKAWEGTVAGQEYREHNGNEFYLNGGETQLYISFNALGALNPKLTNWPEA
jgi:hypothetical protein